MTRFVLIVLAVSLLGPANSTLSGMECTQSDQTGCKPCYRPDPDPEKKVENKAPNVIDVESDRTELRMPPQQNSAEYSKELLVTVKTTAVDPEGDVLTYSYTISGGCVVGAGKNVTWNLNGVMAGTYTLTAGVDDGCGICGETVTKTVTITEN